MAFAAFLKAKRGEATIPTEATGSVVVAIDDFLCKSDLRRALKSSRGSWSSSAAIRSSGINSGSPDCTLVPGAARSSVTARSSLSTMLLDSGRLGRERLGIGTLQSGAQVLQGAELKLFHRALGASQSLRDFTDTSLLGEAHTDHATLIGRKLVHQQIEPRALIGFLQLESRSPVRKVRKLVLSDLFPCAFRPVDNHVGGNPQQPGGEGHPPPLKTVNAGQGLMEDIRGQV